MPTGYEDVRFGASARSTATACGVRPTPHRSASSWSLAAIAGRLMMTAFFRLYIASLVNESFAIESEQERKNTCSRAATAPAKLACSAGAAVGHLRGANVAVAQVRGLIGRQPILVFERSETVLGKDRHPGVVSRFQPDLIELSGVAAEDQLLGGASGVAERRKPVFLLHVLRNFEAAQRHDLPLRRA